MTTFASSSGATPEIDMAFISELLEEIERNPPALEARKIIIQQYMEVGWFDAAGDGIQQLLLLDPDDMEAPLWAEIVLQHDLPPPPSQKATRAPPPEVQLNADLDLAKLELQQGYKALRERAEKLLREACLIRDVALRNDEPYSVNSKGKMKAPWSSYFIVPEKKENEFTARFQNHIHNLTEMVDGKVSAAARVRQPRSARAVAGEMEESPHKAVEIAITDLKDMAGWLRSPTSHSTAEDDLREALAKRVQALSTVLPEELKRYAQEALMHTEHEFLHKKYLSDETMLGEPVADIPRSNFWVTEDGYPWDMEELAQSIASNGGVMRNPLSRNMFTVNDIRAIVAHPLGKHLAALEMEQKSLSQGVRPKTISEIEKMATVLLEDMSEDAMESRKVVDLFLAYTATLPASEQKALDELKVPAKDSHTGQGYDTSIGEAVRDAQGNRVCFHKTGDFLRQAASHLRKKR